MVLDQQQCLSSSSKIFGDDQSKVLDRDLVVVTHSALRSKLIAPDLFKSIKKGDLLLLLILLDMLVISLDLLVILLDPTSLKILQGVLGVLNLSQEDGVT